MSDGLGGLFGTVLVGGLMLGVASSMFNGPRRSTTTTTTNRKGKRTVRTTTRGRINGHPGNFGNVLLW